MRLEKSHKVEVSNGDEVMLKQSTGIVIVVLRSEKNMLYSVLWSLN